MTGPTGDDGLAAALIQLADHTERISSLEMREDTHHQEVTARLRDLAAETTTTTARTNALNATVSHHAAIVNALDGLDAQVAELARQLAGRAAASTGGKDDGYQPVPSPRWWKLRGPDRDTATGRLRAWVERIYQPRLREDRRGPPAVLGTAPRLPVHPRLAQRTVVRPLPRPATRRPHPRRPGGMADPAAARRRRADGLRSRRMRPQPRRPPSQPRQRAATRSWHHR